MELMVVIVIVAILAAVAVPLYINYVRTLSAPRPRARLARSSAPSRFTTRGPGPTSRLATTAAIHADPPPAGLGIDLTES